MENRQKIQPGQEVPGLKLEKTELFGVDKFGLLPEFDIAALEERSRQMRAIAARRELGLPLA